MATPSASASFSASGLIGRSGDAVARLRRDLRVGRAEGGDESVDLGLACGRIGEHREQRADRFGLATGADQHAADDRVIFGVDLIGDLGGLDQAQGLAAREGVAFLHHPFGDGALGHLDAPFGHAEGSDIGHVRYPYRQPNTLRTAASILSADGR
jgi:hypothetical protein